MKMMMVSQVYCTVITIDKFGQCDITFFGPIVESLQMKIVYQINHVYLGKYKSKRILKTGGVSKVKQLEEEINIDVNAEIQCRFPVVNLNTLETKVRCYKYK